MKKKKKKKMKRRREKKKRKEENQRIELVWERNPRFKRQIKNRYSGIELGKRRKYLVNI